MPVKLKGNTFVLKSVKFQILVVEKKTSALLMNTDDLLDRNNN